MPTFVQHISYFLTDNFGTIQEIISDVFIFTLINGQLFAERLDMASSVVQRKDLEIAASFEEICDNSVERELVGAADLR